MAALATPEDLATFLQRDLSAADTASAVLLLDLASAAVRAYTGQTISAVPGDSVTLDVPYGYQSRLFLPELPVTAVTSVTVAGTLYTPVTDYHVDLATGSIRFLTRTWWSYYPPTTAVVVYSHGYAAGTSGLAVAQGATLALATGALQSAGADVKSESIGNYSVTYDLVSSVLWSEESAGLRASLDSLRPLVLA